MQGSLSWIWIEDDETPSGVLIDIDEVVAFSQEQNRIAFFLRGISLPITVTYTTKEIANKAYKQTKQTIIGPRPTQEKS